MNLLENLNMPFSATSGGFACAFLLSVMTSSIDRSNFSFGMNINFLFFWFSTEHDVRPTRFARMVKGTNMKMGAIYAIPSKPPIITRQFIPIIMHVNIIFWSKEMIMHVVVE